MDGDAQAIMSQPPTTQMARGAANGLSAGVVEGGEPPAPSAGGVLVNSSGQAANAVSGTPGYVPSTATLNSGGNDAGDSGSSPSSGNATNNVKAGGTVELFTDSSGPKVSGAMGVGPTDPTAVAADATNMPNIASNSQAKVVANNPFIPASGGGTGSMMNYLPEAARITESGGQVVINGNSVNPYFSNMPTAAQFDQLGLKIQYQGALLPEYQGLDFARTDGSPIPNSTMRSIVFVKK